MKSIKFAMFFAMAFLALNFVSCGNKAAGEEDKKEGDSTTTQKEEPKKEEESGDLGKLSEGTKAALTKVVKGNCDCFSQHKEEAKGFADAVNPVVEKIEKGEVTKPEEAFAPLMGAMMKLQKFDECTKKHEFSADEKKAADEEMDKLYSGMSSDEKEMKKMEMMVAVMKKDCPDGAPLFESILKMGKAMQKMKPAGK